MNPGQLHSMHWSFIHFAIGTLLAWGFLELLVWEDRENTLTVMLENIRSENLMYHERVRFLEDDLRALRGENDRLSLWLQTKPDTIPYYVNQITGLKKENKSLQDKIALFQKKVTPKGWTVIGNNAPKAKKKDLYSHLERMKPGESFEDGTTGLRFALEKINKNFTVEITVNMPGQGERLMLGVKSGAGWPFKHGGNQYLLVIRKVDWFAAEVEVEVQQVK